VAAGVVPSEPAEQLRAAGDLVGPAVLVLQDLTFDGRVDASARLFSALVPTAPIDWVTPSAAHSLAYSFEV
jgi:hypothetical protein